MKEDRHCEEAKPTKQSSEQKTGSPRPQGRPRDDVKEQGGPKGPEPTRYGDWELNGKCVDF